MATIQDLGKVAYVSKGNYSSATEYEINDVVIYEGSSYVSLLNHNRGNLPTNVTYWQLMVQKPVKNVDYFTESDKQEMIDEVTEDAESEFNQNAQAKTEAFNTNASDKTSVFNQNATSKTNDFNSNASSKTTAFNNNATSKTTDYDTNASNKTDVFDDHVTDKIDEFDEHVDDKTDEFDLHVAMLEEDVENLRDNQLFNDAEEKEIYIEDAAKARVYDFELSKESSQETTSIAGGDEYDSPTPEHPQEVKTVKGYRNLYDGEYEIGVYNTTTGYKATGSDTYRNTNFISVIPNETYKFYINNVDINYNLRYFFYDINKNFISTSISQSEFTVPNNCYYVNWHSSAMYTNNPDGLLKPMILEGTEVKPYVPYGNNYVDVKVMGKNILDESKMQASANTTITNGVITTLSLSSFKLFRVVIPTFELKTGDEYYVTFDIKRDSGSASRLSYGGRFYNANDDLTNTSLYQEYTLSSNYQRVCYKQTATKDFAANYLLFQVQNNTTDEIYSITNIVISKTPLDSYEPYKETIVPLPLNGNEIVGLGTYLDELIVNENGHLYLNKKTGKKILDGSENYYYVSSNHRFTLLQDIGMLAMDTVTHPTIRILSDKYIEHGTRETFDYGITRANATSTYNFEKLVIANKDYSSANSFKQALSQNNVTIYYPLETPNLIDLNTTVDLRLFKGTNNITNSEDANMKISYVQNLEIYLENRFSSIENALLEIGGE